MTDRGATFQAEFNRKRMRTGDIGLLHWSISETMLEIASAVLVDTVRNGGTFVVSVSEDTITMVQRPEAVLQETKE